jgi:hypothetical protein
MQPLVDFDGQKRTCATRLAMHNARRREQNAVRLGASLGPLQRSRRPRRSRSSGGSPGATSAVTASSAAELAAPAPACWPLLDLHAGLLLPNVHLPYNPAVLHQALAGNPLFDFGLADVARA